MAFKLVMPNQFGEVSINTPQNAPDAGGPCLFGDEGVPDMDAVENSLYLRTDAPSLDAWLYRNTDGADTWEAINSGSAAEVLATALTGFSAGAGTVAATDTVLQAFNKLAGNTQNRAVTANLLTGLAAGANTPIAAGDTILVALANLQAQIDAL